MEGSTRLYTGEACKQKETMGHFDRLACRIYGSQFHFAWVILLSLLLFFGGLLVIWQTVTLYEPVAAALEKGRLYSQAVFFHTVVDGLPALKKQINALWWQVAGHIGGLAAGTLCFGFSSALLIRYKKTSRI